MKRILAVSLLLAALDASAHGTPPQALSIQERPGNPSELLVGTTFGALISTDGGKSWHLVCEEAIGYGMLERPNWWLSPSGATFSASLEGLFVSRDGLCTWTPHPQFPTGGASDIRGANGVVVAVTGAYSSSGASNGIYRSTDDGMSFDASVGTLDDAGFYSTVRFAPSNPQRVYVAEWWFDPYSDKVRVSNDGALTFSTVDHTADLPTTGSFYVLAVSPANPDVLLAEVTSGTSPSISYLLLSENAGTTFSSVASYQSSANTGTFVFNSAAFSPDGMRAWASVGNILYASNDGAHSFNALSPPQAATCAWAYDDRLYTCSKQELDGWEVGKGSTSAAPGFGPQLIWQQIGGPLDCGANTQVKDVCSVVWPVIQIGFAGPPPGFDAGYDGGGSGGGAGGSGGAGGGGGNGNKSCGCGTGGSAVSLVLWLLIALRPRRR